MTELAVTLTQAEIEPIPTPGTDETLRETLAASVPR